MPPYHTINGLGRGQTSTWHLGTIVYIESISRTLVNSVFCMASFNVYIFSSCISWLTADGVNNTIVFFVSPYFLPADSAGWGIHLRVQPLLHLPPRPGSRVLWPGCQAPAHFQGQPHTPQALFIELTFLPVFDFISTHSQHPKLYQPGQLSLFFNYKEFAVSAVQGFLTSMLLFLLPMGKYSLLDYYVNMLAFCTLNLIRGQPSE